MGDDKKSISIQGGSMLCRSTFSGPRASLPAPQAEFQSPTFCSQCRLPAGSEPRRCGCLGWPGLWAGGPPVFRPCSLSPADLPGLGSKTQFLAGSLSLTPFPPQQSHSPASSRAPSCFRGKSMLQASSREAGWGVEKESDQEKRNLK